MSLWVFLGMENGSFFGFLSLFGSILSLGVTKGPFGSGGHFGSIFGLESYFGFILAFWVTLGPFWYEGNFRFILSAWVTFNRFGSRGLFGSISVWGYLRSILCQAVILSPFLV